MIHRLISFVFVSIWLVDVEVLCAGQGQSDVRQAVGRPGARQTARLGGPGAVRHLGQEPPLPHRH